MNLNLFEIGDIVKLCKCGDIMYKTLQRFFGVRVTIEVAKCANCNEMIPCNGGVA